MEQLDRARRYLERMQQACSSVPYRRDASDYYADDVYSFFVHCYHVRDWLIRLGLAPADAVDRYVNDNLELSICADLCNGMKHCRLDRKRTSSQPYVGGHRLSGSGRVMNPQDGVIEPANLQCLFEVHAEGEYYDALWVGPADAWRSGTSSSPPCQTPANKRIQPTAQAVFC